jgi:hypothetical protein
LRLSVRAPGGKKRNARQQRGGGVNDGSAAHGITLKYILMTRTTPFPARGSEHVAENSAGTIEAA